MVLDARLKKLVTGISARKAAEAFSRSLKKGTELSKLEQEEAGEFAATVEIMFLMAAVDGEVSEEELGRLKQSVSDIANVETIRKLDLDQLLEGFAAKLARDGWHARLGEAVRRIPTNDAKAFAFRLAAGVALVDDNVAHAEAAAINSLAAAIGLSHEESQVVLNEVLEELFGPA